MIYHMPHTETQRHTYHMIIRWLIPLGRLCDGSAILCMQLNGHLLAQPVRSYTVRSSATYGGRTSKRHTVRSSATYGRKPEQNIHRSIISHLWEEHLNDAPFDHQPPMGRHKWENTPTVRSSAAYGKKPGKMRPNLEIEHRKLQIMCPSLESEPRAISPSTHP